MQLLIGNKNYSSWSMRPWVLMTEAGIAFEEVPVRFDAFTAGSVFKTTVARHSPAGKVPVLIDDDGHAVWDTLAIAETLAERFPEKALWPASPAARSRARSVTAEMHAGFSALRQHFPMNIEANLPEVGARVLRDEADVRDDLARLEHLWTDALAASGGPFLFGGYCIADAFFVPVAMRLATYAVATSPDATAYLDRLRATASVGAWVDAARRERDFLAFEEPYRSGPAADPPSG